jgi:predicted DNA-binding transcriptional regulator YafY
MDMAQNPKQSKIIDWGGNPYYKGKEYLAPLYRAVSERKQVQMTYTPFSKESKTFLTNPVYLKQYNNRWFLIAMLEEDGFVYINAFDRINNLVVLDTAIPEIITFDAEEYFDPIVGVSRPVDGELEEIEIQLTPESYPYVKTKPIHHSQINYDEECKVKIRVIRNRELEMILSSIK